ncbi:hypothetical protein EGW08_008128 [Elysia chlorotica]|uniref:Uncharacterized protein n=1 Tax=Elysia chlorotica TaxID=188477 RepID=A0A3S0ZRF1_ELYCH|nr:hypothetical protein EGW08_008128 [Elysia chlorotica]
MMQCEKQVCLPPTDVTQTGVCQEPPVNPSLPRGLNCGCPVQDDCCVGDLNPYALETHIFQQPRLPKSSNCSFCIPGMLVSEEREQQGLRSDPLCFDWTVNEPGPNDSYGLNGLNYYDWEMKAINNFAIQAPTKGHTPSHPGFSKTKPPSATPVYQCRLPIACYARFPGPCRSSPSFQSVNYFKNSRGCQSPALPPWKPPYAQWATNQHL